MSTIRDGTVPMVRRGGVVAAPAEVPQAKFPADATGEPEPVAVTSDVTMDWNPVWSPDGRSLYFASERGGSMNLWRVA